MHGIHVQMKYYMEVNPYKLAVPCIIPIHACMQVILNQPLHDVVMVRLL